MEHNEQDTHNTPYREFHPLQFASWVFIAVLIMLIAATLYIRFVQSRAAAEEVASAAVATAAVTAAPAEFASAAATAEKSENPAAPQVIQKWIGKSVIISGSLAKSAKKAGIANALIFEFSRIFNWDVEYQKKVRKGDVVKIIYEGSFLGDKLIKVGNILAGEIVMQGKSNIAIRYKIKNSVHYYTERGENLSKAFMRFPLQYFKISSPFNARRMNPILHIIRPHEGVDLKAPYGTPIKAVGSGTIAYQGREGGYGKLVMIRHSSVYSTRYAHLSQFAKGLHKGSVVEQGQVIGYIGQTGFATGPHLHFEFRINGVAYDPVKVKLPSGNAIPANQKDAFLAYAKPLLEKLTQLMPPAAAV
jgi:murein DD-endopeptidase MepM/ murein hydrolase activator NlpD